MALFFIPIQTLQTLFRLPCCRHLLQTLQDFSNENLPLVIMFLFNPFLIVEILTVF